MLGEIEAFESLCLKVGVQGIDDIIEGPIENGVQAIQGEVDAMVGNTILGKIIGPNPFAPISRANLTFPVLGDFGFLFHLHLVQESGAEDLQGFSFVLELRFLVLADHHQASGQVSDAYG